MVWEVPPKSVYSYLYEEKFVSLADWNSMPIPDPGRYVLHPVGIHSETNEVFYVGGPYGHELEFCDDGVYRIGVRIVNIQSRYNNDLKRSYRDVCSSPSSATAKSFFELLLAYCNSYEQSRGEYEAISISKENDKTRITVRNRQFFAERIADDGQNVLGNKITISDLKEIVDNASNFIIRPSRDPHIYQNVSNAESLHKLVLLSKATQIKGTKL